MLDADADGERLGVDAHAARQQRAAKVSRALWPIARTTWLQFRVLPSDRGQRAQAAIGDVQVGDLVAEAVLAAQRLDGGAQCFSTTETQPEGSDMRAGLTVRISAGAPAWTNSVSTRRP